MILSSQVTANDAQQMLDFYKHHFSVVDLVSCGLCGSFLAFECQGGDSMGLLPNELGKYVIPIDDNLQSHRVRLDEAPTGERMVGYQCGAPVPNPKFPAAAKQFEEDLLAYHKQYEKDIKAHKAALKKLKKNDNPPPEPAYSPPLMTEPETIPCGNDTRIADVERGVVPVGSMQTALSPFEKHKISEALRTDKSHKPDFKKAGNIKHFETFKVERIT